jgi:hypothetical protein
VLRRSVSSMVPNHTSCSRYSRMGITTYR